MATESIHKLDSHTVAASADTQNRERNRDRRKGKAVEKEKPFTTAETKPAVETPGPDLGSSQIVDSSTVIELLAHRPLPNTHARFLSKSPPRANPDRRNPGGKKLDKSA